MAFRQMPSPPVQQRSSMLASIGTCAKRGICGGKMRAEFRMTCMDRPMHITTPARPASSVHRRGSIPGMTKVPPAWKRTKTQTLGSSVSTTERECESEVLREIPVEQSSWSEHDETVLSASMPSCPNWEQRRCGGPHDEHSMRMSFFSTGSAVAAVQRTVYFGPICVCFSASRPTGIVQR